MSTSSGYPKHEHQHDGAYAAGDLYEPDMGGNVPWVIFSYIVVLSAAFFLSLLALMMYFKWEADAEIERKVRTYESPAIGVLRGQESRALGGGENRLPIEEAIKRVTAEQAN
jgi:hypothetical protein